MGYSTYRSDLFALLPSARAPWKEFVLGSGTQACLVALLIWLRLLHPNILSAPEHTFRSVQLVSAPAPENHHPRRRMLSVALARLDPPVDALQLPPAQTKPVARIETMLPPSVQITARNLDSLPAPIAPAVPKVVRTNLFSSGSSAAQATARAVSQVQTGGFGDPHGIPAEPASGKAVNIAAVGAFDLPSGPGSGNGTGGATGTKGVVASSGFGNGIATQAGAPRNGSVQITGFGDAGAPAPAGHSHSAEIAAPLVPAEIISKPTPVYTQEARSLRIEGEVLLEVVLGSSGGLHVLRVVRGLGHGLDDSAVKAAEQIRFKPAMRNGQPADSTVVLHIIFQLA